MSMANRESMNVSLTPELAAFVERQVASGRYRSASEVVRQGLRELQDREEWKAEVRAKIEEAVKSVEAGRVVDGEEVMDRMEARLRAMIEAEDERRRSA
jgi:antitoxin ParD1/3/4